ncbi:unnamed protein product [Adineta ricciae]|uniref:Uncharacterized protein n=1 Tax=Adineta ricciae TaxID=249248 RepID=A0A814EH45_ADIRI|nr:unnamed protein product [Adineta ricciae]
MVFLKIPVPPPVPLPVPALAAPPPAQVAVLVVALPPRISVRTVTTSISCPAGYVLSGLSTCVNLQIDYNNCGSLGNVCPNNYASCSAGVCSNAPAVQLLHAIAIPGWDGSSSVDDAVASLTLPSNLSLTLYGYSSSKIYISSNGVICLVNCMSEHTNAALPTTAFKGPTALALWDDLMIYSGTSQGVYYPIEGGAPNRTTTFEFYTSKFNASQNYYHFQVKFYENQPDIVEYIYYEVSDKGGSATIGTQKSISGPDIEYSMNKPNAVWPNMTLTFNTNTNTYWIKNGTIA